MIQPFNEENERRKVIEKTFVYTVESLLKDFPN